MLFAFVVTVLVVVNLRPLLELYRAWRVGYRFDWMPVGVLPYGQCHLLNESGQVAVGRMEAYHPADAGLWSSSGTRFLSSPRYERTAANAINNHGHIVGQCYRSGGPVNLIGLTFDDVIVTAAAFFWSPKTGMVETPAIATGVMMPSDINDRDEVVGSIGTLSGQHHAALWRPGFVPQDLGTLTENGDSFAVAINEESWIVGNATTANGARHPVLWRADASITDLGLPPDFTRGYAISINDHGVVLVDLERDLAAGDSLRHAFLWTEGGGYEQILPPAGHDAVEGYQVTNRGQVLLRARRRADEGYTNFLYQRGRFVQLPDATTDGITKYYSINDRGWLAGFVEPTGQSAEVDRRRGFVAVPVRLGS